MRFASSVAPVTAYGDPEAAAVSVSHVVAGQCPCGKMSGWRSLQDREQPSRLARACEDSARLRNAITMTAHASVGCCNSI